MHIVRLIHWNEDEAIERAAKIQRRGYKIDSSPFSQWTLKELQVNRPNAVVIDLSRLPSQGRDVAMAIRSYKSTRTIPIIFVAGDEEKLVKIKRQLPDAEYTSWDKVNETIERAVKNHPAQPFAPRSRLEGYSGMPLAKKLGIKPGTTIVLLGAPDGFENQPGKLPSTINIRRDDETRPDLTIWFARHRDNLERELPRMVRLAEKAGLWIAWPKKSSGEKSDLSETIVRKLGLAAGLVDYKICSIDSTWSGLKFTTRKPRKTQTLFPRKG